MMARHRYPSIKTTLLWLLAFGVVVADVIFGVAWWQQRRVLGSYTDMTASQIMTLTNQERRRAGVSPVQSHPLLTQAAEEKAAHMVATGKFEHYYQAEGELINPWQFILDSGYDYFHAGENLGKDYFRAKDLVQGWMDSPTHRQNLLNPDYVHTGVSVVEGPYLGEEKTTLIVQLFATPTELVTDNLVKPSSPQTINIAPLLEREQSWAQVLVSQYPMILLISTILVMLMVGGSLLIDHQVVKTKTSKNQVSIELWRH